MVIRIAHYPSAVFGQPLLETLLEHIKVDGGPPIRDSPPLARAKSRRTLCNHIGMG